MGTTATRRSHRSRRTRDSREVAALAGAVREALGFSVRTIQEWEQGRALPDRPARILLRVIEKSPKTVARAVAEL